jgi:hypothetical protein
MPLFVKKRGANGEFPRSIRIGARAVVWLESDIDQWIETRRIGAEYSHGQTISTERIRTGLNYLVSTQIN